MMTRTEQRTGPSRKGLRIARSVFVKNFGQFFCPSDSTLKVCFKVKYCKFQLIISLYSNFETHQALNRL